MIHQLVGRRGIDIALPSIDFDIMEYIGILDRHAILEVDNLSRVAGLSQEACFEMQVRT